MIIVNIVNNFAFLFFLLFRTHNLSDRSSSVSQFPSNLFKHTVNLKQFSLLGSKSMNVGPDEHGR